MLKKIALAGVALAALTAAASAKTPDGFYLGGFAGANWVDTYNPNAPAALVGSLESDLGWYSGVTAGYKFPMGLRLEFEGGYRFNNVNETILATPYVGDMSATTAMLNVLYDIPVSETFAFSVGAGVGLARVGIEMNDGAAGNIIDDRDFVLAYQGILEASYAATDNITLYGGYHYMMAESFKLNGRNGVTPRLFMDDYKSNSLVVGLRYSFAAAPVAVEAPQLPPVTPSKTYIVYFDFNRSDLRADAMAVVQAAAAEFKAGGKVAIQVVGHTDTVGGAAYNQALSERRAASVKNGLTAEGIPGDVISTSGKGFSEPLVATGPGVKSQDNRRATIDLTPSAGM
jgi:OmpA-OmpF porin, OOP family